MRPPIIALPLAISLLAAPVSATTDRQQCSPSLLRTVELQMPPLGRSLAPAMLSCNGLTQLYFLLTGSSDLSREQRRQQIIAVFRREGLTG